MCSDRHKNYNCRYYHNYLFHKSKYLAHIRHSICTHIAHTVNCNTHLPILRKSTEFYHHLDLNNPKE
jgi:hypothetical protein